MAEAKTSLPQGAFYFFVHFGYCLEGMKRDNRIFCNGLERKNVVLATASGSGANGAGHTRVTFASEPEN